MSIKLSIFLFYGVELDGNWRDLEYLDLYEEPEFGKCEAQWLSGFDEDQRAYLYIPETLQRLYDGYGDAKSSRVPNKKSEWDLMLHEAMVEHSLPVSIGPSWWVTSWYR